MIDTIHILKECEFPYLQWKTIEEGLYGTHIKGHIYNMRIRWSNGKLHIQGSLPKLHNGTNFYNLSTYEIGSAVVKLETELMLDLQDATVYRIDLAANIPLSHSVSTYFDCFGQHKNYHRSNIQESSLYYSKGKNAQTVIYDKIKEMKQKPGNKEILDKINGNFMRFEIRCTKSQIKNLIKEDFKVRDLKTIEINSLLADIWYNSYLCIQKEYAPQFDFKAGEGYKDFCNCLMMYGINHLGGAYSTKAILKNSPGFNLLRPEYKSRIRGKIKELNLNAVISDNGALLLELNNVFKQTHLEFARNHIM